MLIDVTVATTYDALKLCEYDYDGVTANCSIITFAVGVSTVKPALIQKKTGSCDDRVQVIQMIVKRSGLKRFDYFSSLFLKRNSLTISFASYSKEAT